MMKRFWKEAAFGQEDCGWGIALDGKPLRTPGRRPLVVPTQRLAEAIADEWNAAGDEVKPRVMPLTGLANAALDLVAPDPGPFASGLAAYGESDLVCYRAEAPSSLLARQEQSWNPLLAWGRRRFEVDFTTTCGIIHVPQPGASVQRLAHAVTTLTPFQLAALSPLVTIGGSLLAALAVVEGAISPEGAWHAVSVDDRWQLEQWGSDVEAEAMLAARRSDFLAAARFLELLES
jgi:chaperone required for assembly of F1-ATPase